MESSVSREEKVCFLCGRVGGYMLRFERWTEKERAYVLHHLELPPPKNAVTCKKDKLEARRHCNDNSHIPKWKKQINDEQTYSYIHPNCKATSKEDRIIHSPFTEDTIKAYLDLHTIPHQQPYTMCRKHYYYVYNAIHRPVICASCGAKPKAGHRFDRHSPDTYHISRLLQTTDTEVKLTKDDYICYNCYKIHLSILKNVKLSNDFLEEKIRSWLSTYHDTSTDRLTKSILRAVLVVSDNLLHIVHCYFLK